MSPSAWIFMLTAWAIILVMTLYFFAKLLSSPSVLHEESEEPPDRPEPWGAPPTLPDA